MGDSSSLATSDRYASDSTAMAGSRARHPEAPVEKLRGEKCTAIEACYKLGDFAGRIFKYLEKKADEHGDSFPKRVGILFGHLVSENGMKDQKLFRQKDSHRHLFG
jgi:hypothetical protein